ncbi:hypothetical protein MRX96_015536 [Rhipicephalus microplus]
MVQILQQPKRFLRHGPIRPSPFPGYRTGRPSSSSLGSATWRVSASRQASVDFYGFTRSHHLLAAANVYILENLADLSLVPPVGAHAIVMPMKKIDGAGGAPTRVAALLP